MLAALALGFDEKLVPGGQPHEAVVCRGRRERRRHGRIECANIKKNEEKVKKNTKDRHALVGDFLRHVREINTLVCGQSCRPATKDGLLFFGLAHPVVHDPK